MSALKYLAKNLTLVNLGLIILTGFSLSCTGIRPFPSGQPGISPAISEPTAPANLNSKAALVTRVIDGDTIEVDINGRAYTVRYIGIDAPETVAPNQPVEPYGPEASAKNKQLVLGKTIRLEKDISETDKYGRLLRYVYADGLFVNAELVRLGYAQAISYPPDVKYQSLLLQLQNEARMAGRGLWGPTPPAATATPTQPPAANILSHGNNIKPQ